MIDPAADSGNYIDLPVDPTFVRVVRIPERARRAIAQLRHLRRHIVAEGLAGKTKRLATLRVPVHREDVETALTRLGVVLVQLVQ